jgi:polyribonucleotide nucleotidyltransferase
MKTIIETSTNISKYTFDDAHDLVVTADNITCPHFIIGDMNSSNATIVEGVTPPADWVGCKYTYVDSTWTINPNYEEETED